MKESLWGVFIVTIGVVTIVVMLFLQNVTNTDDQNYNLLKETTEAAMYDAIDLAYYKSSGQVKINREKFVENFVRRFAENASLQNSYRIEIYDVNELPPKVSLKVSSSLQTGTGSTNGKKIEFDITNRLDAILETPY